MAERTIGTREDWQAARSKLAKLEQEYAELGTKVTERRRALPWVPVEKEYELDTEDGTTTLAELFEGRSQLLAYNIMFGPDYSIGACPGCTMLGDEIGATRGHLEESGVTLVCFSRAPIDRLTAYKEQMGWDFPYISTYNSDFAYDFGLAMTPEAIQSVPMLKDMTENPPPNMVKWSADIGATVAEGIQEVPAYIAFARDDGTIYHTYTVTAPDPFVAPYHSFLLKRTPLGEASE
jgi:predicted dithiol-disulfide oxidoreductase (DUF899 family)